MSSVDVSETIRIAHSVIISLKARLAEKDGQIARLREALEKIAECERASQGGYFPDSPAHDADTMHETARAALAFVPSAPDLDPHAASKRAGMEIYDVCAVILRDMAREWPADAERLMQASNRIICARDHYNRRAAIPARAGELADDGWCRDMEAAPRDGACILVCNARIMGGFYQVVSWDIQLSADAAKSSHCWWTNEANGNHLGYHDDAWTCWRPLPPPPDPDNGEARR